MAHSKDLATIAAAYARALAQDLVGLMGAEMSVKLGGVEVIERNEAFKIGEPLAHATCTPKDDSPGIAHLLIPTEEALVLASQLMGFNTALINEKRKGSFDEELLDAFGEVMNLAAAVLGRVLMAEDGLPDLRSNGVKEIPIPEADSDWLPEGIYRRARFAMELPEGLGSGTFDVLFPSEWADAWFGEIASKKASPAASSGVAQLSPDPVGTGPIVFLDGDEEDRRTAEGIEDDLGRSVWTFGPAEFGLETIEEVEDAAAFVVAWDLGGRSGLDVLETLLLDIRTRNIPIVMASPNPTRNMVMAAMRAGAHSFVFKPYTSEELRVRLAEVLGGPQEGEGDSFDAAEPSDTASEQMPAE
jgi:CheY-like chemotaxis protein